MPSSLARRLALLFLFAFAAPLHAGPARPPLIPAADFAADPLLRAPQLSPDGKHVFGTMVLNNKQELAVLDLATGQLQPFHLPDKMDFRWARWAGNDRLLVSLLVQAKYFGVPISSSRMVALRL